jgi:O-antigen ligase
LYLLAVPVAVVAGAAVGEPTFALSYGVMICAAVFAFGLPKFRTQTPDILAVCLTLFTVTSFFWTVSPEATDLNVKSQFGVVVMFLAVRAVAVDGRNIAVIVVGYLAGCGYSLALQSKGMDAQIAAGGDRFSIAGLNQNYLAYSLCTAAALLVILWIQWTPFAGRGLYLFGRLTFLTVAFTLCVGVVWTGTRGAEVSLLGLAMWIVCHRFAPRRGLSILYGAVIVAALAILTGFFDQLILSHLSRTFRESGDLNGRLFLWPLARRIFADHPFIGTGAGTFRVLNGLNLPAHNVILEFGTGLGMVGVGLFVGTLVTALITGTRAMDGHTRALLVGSMVVVSAPIFLSGAWDQSPAAWVAIALFSRIAVLVPALKRPESGWLESEQTVRTAWRR